MNGTKAKPSLLHVPRLKVSATALEWVSHAGVGLLREVADLSGLSAQVTEVLADTFKGPWVHDPGSVFTDLAAAVADGADCMSGIGQLLDQQAQHGPVASVTTSWRMIDQRIDAQHLAGVTKSTVREKVWAAGGAPQVGTTLVIDVDATITIDQYEGKEHPASTWKRTCGYHQLLAVLDRPDISDGEALAALLRGGERRLQYRRRSHHYVDRGVGVGGRPSTGPRHSGDNIAGHRAGEGLPSSRRHSSARSTPHTPEGSWRLRFQVLHRVHGLRRANSGSAPSAPTLTGGTSNDAAGLPFMLRTAQLLPQRGFCHWASTTAVSNRSRQSATGPPDSYPDRTHTGKRRRARTIRSPRHEAPPVPLGARMIEASVRILRRCAAFCWYTRTAVKAPKGHHT